MTQELLKEIERLRAELAEEREERKRMGRSLEDAMAAVRAAADDRKAIEARRAADRERRARADRANLLRDAAAIASRDVRAPSSRETHVSDLPPPLEGSPPPSVPSSPSPISSPPSFFPPSASPREELRLEPQEAPRRTRRKEPAPTDPRHAPLVKTLVEEIGFPFDGGKDAQNVKALLALADQQPATSGEAAPAEILRRARIARGQYGFNSARTLGDFRAHWGRFEAPEQHRAGPAPPSDFSRPPAVPPRSEFAPEVSDEPF